MLEMALLANFDLHFAHIFRLCAGFVYWAIKQVREEHLLSVENRALVDKDRNCVQNTRKDLPSFLPATQMRSSFEAFQGRSLVQNLALIFIIDDRFVFFIIYVQGTAASCVVRYKVEHEACEVCPLQQEESSVDLRLRIRLFSSS